MKTEPIKPHISDWMEAYSRQIVLEEIGYEGQKKISNSRVCIIGVGGLGSESAIRLTGMGVKYLRIVDRDVVSRSDLHRQTLYDLKSVGKSKVEAAAERLSGLNPNVRLDPLPVAITIGNVESIVKGVDVVVDGLDSLPPRYLVNEACVKNNIPYVFGSAIESYGNVLTVLPFKTACLDCFYPNLKGVSLSTCASVGVHPSIVGIIANLQVYEATKILMNKTPKLAGKFMYADLRHMTFETVDIKRREDCTTCGQTPTARIDKPIHNPVEEVCGRNGSKTLIVTPPKPLNLEIKDLMKLSTTLGWKPSEKGKFSISLKVKEGVVLNLLKSGVAIVSITPEAAKHFNWEEIKQVYNKLGVNSEFISSINNE